MHISIWQELDELVLTKELTGHLDKIFSVYSDTVDNASRSDASGKVGVWVSGFFGSGKSHFIKVLHYLFSNTEAEKDGVRKKAVKFFEEKISDAMEKTVPKAELVLLDWKGLKEHKQRIVDMLDELGVDWKKTKEF